MNPKYEMILEKFKESQEDYNIILNVARDEIIKKINEIGLYVCSVEGRVKGYDSFAGKLERKGEEYTDIYDVTDLIGLRIVTFYTTDVDKVASLISNTFTIDWINTVDKRIIQDSDRFGYLSLHYICSIPKEMYYDPEHPDVNKVKFEVQMRTLLQHEWAVSQHDTGYKTDIEIPKVYKRRLLRLAGLLEIADQEFSSIMIDIENYRRNVRELIRKNNIDELEFNKDTYDSYMSIEPFKPLSERIASINKAELTPTSNEPYFPILKQFGIRTLRELDEIREAYSEDAYRFGVAQLAKTDIDILASTIGLQNVCIVYAIKKFGMQGLIQLYVKINKTTKSAEASARRTMKLAESLNIVYEDAEETY